MSTMLRTAFAVAIAAGALTFAAIEGFSQPDHGVVKKSDRLRMEITVACGSDVVSDAVDGCATLAHRAPRTKPGVSYETTAYQDGPNTTILVRSRLEK